VEVWEHEARLTPTFSFEVPVTSQKLSSEAILPVSTIVPLNVGTVQFVCYILFFILVFHC
jgi:hypothetical protein